MSAGFYAFGNHFHAKFATQHYRNLDDRQRLLIGQCVQNERSVYLHL